MTLLLALIALASLGFLLDALRQSAEHRRLFGHEERTPRDHQRRAYRDAVGFPISQTEDGS